MKAAIRLFLMAISVVTIADIVVIHWIGRRHRLFEGRHVLLAESGLLLLASSYLLLALRKP